MKEVLMLKSQSMARTTQGFGDLTNPYQVSILR